METAGKSMVPVSPDPGRAIMPKAPFLLQDKIKSKDLRDSMKWLLELATCPICLGTLTPATKQCINGHPICVSCHSGLQTCPTCRSDFSNVQPTGFIQQVIEALPHPCRFLDCSYFVKTNDDHEKFCGKKPTECKYCDWSGPGQHILSHIQSNHQKWLLETKDESFHFNLGHEAESTFSPLVFKNHFFWREIKYDPEKKNFTAIIHWIPNGKTTDNLYVELFFKGYETKLQINMNPEIDPYKDNCILIPTYILRKSAIENHVFCTFSIKKSQWKSLCNFVTAKYKWMKKKKD